MRIRKLSYEFLNSVRTGYNFPAWVEAFGHWARVDLDNPKNYRCWLGAKFHSGEPVEHKRYIPIRDDEALAFDEALKAPGLNIPPLLWKIMSEVPSYWDKLPEDQKQALFNALVAAGTKAANEYAKKPD